MKGASHYVGQRLSLKGQLCTVRYKGEVASKPGEWLGVEWDDITRGKHDGTFESFKYFSCRSRSSKCASFLRVSQAWDKSSTFLQALKDKYISPENASHAQVVYISGKQAEEVGFDKFARRQAELRGIFVLVLENMRIRHTDTTPADDEEVSLTCANITELNLGRNLFEDVDEILRLCRLLPKLRTLILDGNRFSIKNTESKDPVDGVHSLSISETLFSAEDTSDLFKYFPSVRSLTAARNESAMWSPAKLPRSITTLELSTNQLSSIADVRGLSELPRLERLIVKGNMINTVGLTNNSPSALISSTVLELDLAQNSINTWSFFADIAIAFPSLKSLRTSTNPLYLNLKAADGKHMTAEDGYMLTVARLPLLEMLNYSKISAKDRLNAETYYLGQIVKELSMVPVEQAGSILDQHPRWRSLCEEYGEPVITRQLGKDELDPRSLAARLVTITFRLAEQALPNTAERQWDEEVPQSMDLYALHGIVAARFDISPLSLRLVWETGERDPVGRDRGYCGPEVWDSSDDDEDPDVLEGGMWVAREVELAPGTRSIATYIEDRITNVRVECEV